MMTGKEYLIPAVNREIGKGIHHFEVFEGWRREEPLFTGTLSSGRIRVTSIGKREYDSSFPDHREFPNYFDLIQKVLHGSGVMDQTEMDPFRERFDSITGDEEPYRRNVRFYYDTNSLMNNYFFNFREYIPDFLKKAGHTTSYGVMAELEKLFDRRLKNQFFPDEFRDIYRDERDMFYRQPNLVGRFSRLAYPEVDLMREKLRSDILTDYETGDTEILNSFISDCNENNLEGIMVTNDSNMAERAGKRMGSWHVRFDLRQIEDLTVNIEYFIKALYRASVIYGRIRINNDIIVDGVWKGKNEEWKDNSVNISTNRDRDLERIERILQNVPGDYFGKGYYNP